MRGFRTSRETKVREFSVGERILATWADGRKYPAKVKAILTNGKEPNLNCKGERDGLRLVDNCLTFTPKERGIYICLAFLSQWAKAPRK